MAGSRVRWLAFAFVLGVTLVTLSAPGDAGAQPTREQQIAELEKQLADLNRKLDELKKGSGAAEGTLPASWTKALTWRSIGPAAMGGRIVAVAVNEADPTMYWVATASGGLLKTTNGGTTFKHQFDREATVSIGDVAVAPSNPSILWVGTGENNPRNSVSYGDGVYKSVDGGETWKNMGLPGTFQIGRIAIHPKNPDIVYVGALGRLYGPNPERGLFKTTDGGKTWAKVLFVDDRTGVIDVQMHPTEPDTLIVATWERKRDGFDSWPGSEGITEGYDGYDPIIKWSVSSGLHRTTDGGKTWKKLTQGLPTGPVGRCGISYHRKNPNVVFAIVDSARIGMGTPPKATFLGVTGEDVPEGARVKGIAAGSPAAKGGLKIGDIIQAAGDKEVKSIGRLVEIVQAKKEGEKLALRVLRDKKTETIEVTLALGTSERIALRPYGAYFGGQRANVQDLQGPDGHEYGGVYRSEDSGVSWKRINSVNPRPMYFSQIRVDPNDDQKVYVLGVDLHRSSDGGKTFESVGKTVHPDQHCLWIDSRDGRHQLLGTDGGLYVSRDRMATWDFLNTMAIGQFYHVCVDNKQPYRVFGGLQDNGSWGGPSRTLTETGPVNDDWIFVGGGDGFVCRTDPGDPDLVYFESQDGGMVRRHLRTGATAFLRPVTPRGQPVYRFNWNTPYLLSHHNPGIFYSAGNHVFRSVRKGTGARVISPEISRTKRGSATALAESPRDPDVLYVGTDDGNLWVTRDGGKEWVNVADKVGLPGPRWVATIEASRHADGRVYVTFDGHRSDDDNAHVYVSENYGQTWKSLRGNLPAGATRVCREDLENPDVLYLGTEFSVFASIDRGERWTKINNNLPTVAVHELAQHPTSGEIVAATHGRSVWILDVTALRQMSAKTVAAKAMLYKPSTVVRWRMEPQRGTIYGQGDRGFKGDNPPGGAQFFVSLKQKVEKATLKVVDLQGQTLVTLNVPREAGLHKLSWDLKVQQTVAGAIGSIFGGSRRPRITVATAGEYKVVLSVDGVDQTETLKLEADPLGIVPPLFAFPEELDE